MALASAIISCSTSKVQSQGCFCQENNVLPRVYAKLYKLETLRLTEI